MLLLLGRHTASPPITSGTHTGGVHSSETPGRRTEVLFLIDHLCSAVWHISPPLGRVTSLCPDYLHAYVSDGGDLSLHQQEVTDGQLVMESLVPRTVDFDVASECHLCCPSPLPMGKVSFVDSS